MTVPAILRETNGTMTEEEAIVLETTGDRAWVQVDGATDCSHCSHSGICGISPQTNRLEVMNPVRARKGDRIIFSFSDRDVFRFTTYLYGLPLLMLLAGGVLGYLIPPLLQIRFSRDAAAAILGFGFLFASFLTLRAISRRLIHKKGMVPRIIRIIHGA